MTFYLIGTGLDINSISADALKVLKECDKIYLENYTVNFPYPISNLEKAYDVKITELSRESTEDESILTNANDQNIALLVYGDSLSATTHMQLIISCIDQNIPYKIFPNASILTAISLTGLQPYKFGKTTSMPNWKEHTNKPKSFTDYIKENQSVNAHSLILTDIGLTLSNAIRQLEESGLNPQKLIVLSNAGTNSQKISYDSPNNLKDSNIAMPFCLIIPAPLHFTESEALDKLKS